MRLLAMYLCKRYSHYGFVQLLHRYLRRALVGAVCLYAPMVHAEDADPTVMTRGEIQLTQEALTWAGNYYGLKDGTWGRIAASAASEWRRQNGLAPSDRFNPAELRLLVGQGDRERTAMGWTTYRDLSTGVWIGYPATLVQPQSPSSSNRGVAVTELRGGDVSLEMMLFGPGFSLRQLREMLASLGQEPQVEQIVYRLDGADRQVQSSNLRSGVVRYIRFDRHADSWRGFVIKITMQRPDVGRLISAISGEFSASGRSVVDDPANLPLVGPMLAASPAAALPAWDPPGSMIDVPPPRQ